MIVEAKVLYELQRGSYEELLQSLDRAVAENQELFGESDAVLFSSYPAFIVVMNEDGQFFNVDFKNKDGVIELGQVRQTDVSVLSEDDVVSRGIDEFFDGGSLSEGLRGVINLHRAVTSPLAKTEAALAVLFSGGQAWRKHLGENRETIGSFAWDAEFGPLKIDIHPMFAEILEGDDLDDADSEMVFEELRNLEQRLYARLSEVNADHERYQARTLGTHDDEEDEVMVRFESFASDYINHLTEIADFVSGAITEGSNCVICAAFVHDEVAKRFKELELGGRFIRKVSAQLSQ